MDVLFFLALAVGICIFWFYAAQAAFRVDSRIRSGIDKKFNDIVRYLKADDRDPGTR